LLSIGQEKPQVNDARGSRIKGLILVSSAGGKGPNTFTGGQSGDSLMKGGYFVIVKKEVESLIVLEGRQKILSHARIAV